MKRSVSYDNWDSSVLPAGAVELLQGWCDDSIRRYCASTHAEQPPVMAPQIDWPGYYPEDGAGEALVTALGHLPP